MRLGGLRSRSTAALLAGPTLAAFRLPGYRALWLAGGAGAFGWSISLVAVGWITLLVSDSPFAVGATFAARLLPALLLGIPMGSLVDRFDRRTTLVVVNVLGALALGVLKVLAGSLLTLTSSNPLLASFAVLVGLLIWFNLVCAVILLGASWVVVTATDAGVPLDPIGERDRRQAEARLRLEIEEEVRAEYEASLPRAVRWLARRRRRT